MDVDLPSMVVVRSIPNGVYLGWSSVARGPVIPAVLSIGENPHFHNQKKTVVCFVV